MNFDRRLEFQFGLFLVAVQAKVAREAIGSLSKHFDDPKGQPRIKFGDPTLEDSVITHGTQVIQVPSVTWTSGLWRMVWSPLRLDVYADARAYADVAERALDLRAVVRRLSSGFRGAAAELNGFGFVVNRLVVVVTGEQTLTPNDPASMRLVTDRLLASHIRDAAGRGEVADAGARVDWRTRFSLPEEGAVPVHRIETIGTELTFTGTSENLILRAQWDVNTSPIRGTAPLRPESFEAFYDAAAAWIIERRSALEKP
jgi:hypothetical protein